MGVPSEKLSHAARAPRDRELETHIMGTIPLCTRIAHEVIVPCPRIMHAVQIPDMRFFRSCVSVVMCEPETTIFFALLCTDTVVEIRSGEATLAGGTGEQLSLRPFVEPLIR